MPLSQGVAGVPMRFMDSVPAPSLQNTQRHCGDMEGGGRLPGSPVQPGGLGLRPWGCAHGLTGSALPALQSSEL